MALDSVTASDVMDEVITPTTENDEVELSTIASIQTLKRKKKNVAEMKCSSWKPKKETFNKLLNQLINSNSV